MNLELTLDIIPIVLTIVFGIMVVWFAYNQIPKNPQQKK